MMDEILKTNQPKKETTGFRKRPQRINKEGEDKKLEFLKREEIRTMRKDLKALREGKAERDRTKITGSKSKKGGFINTPVSVTKKDSSPKLSFIPKSSKSPTRTNKVLRRVGFFLFFVFTIGAVYWVSNFGIPGFESLSPWKNQENIKEDLFISEEPEKEPVVVEKETISPDIISIEKTVSIELINNRGIFATATEQLIEETLPENLFSRILIKDKETGEPVKLESFTEDLYLETLFENIGESTGETFNFLAYPQEEGQREVLIIKIEGEKAPGKTLELWEAKIIEEGFSLFGSLLPTSTTSTFKSFNVNEEIPIRYITISREDLGVCYSLFKDYFILSSSFESIGKALEALDAIIIPTSTPTTTETETVELLPLENIGQLFMVGFEGKIVTPQIETFFEKYKPGGVLLLSDNIESKEQLTILTQELQSLSKRVSGLPLLIAVDQEGGMISRIPFLEEKTPQSEIETTEEAYIIGLARGKELKEVGVNINLAPLLDDLGEENFYFERAFQKTPEVSGELASSLILGQKDAGILSTIKHFPGYTDVSFNPEYDLARINLPEIFQFKKAMEANPELVMVSNAIYPEIDFLLPFAFSIEAIDYLKDELGTSSLIICDDLSQDSLLNNFTLKEILAKPFQAGVDLLIFSGWRSPVDEAMDVFLKMVEDKELSETLVEESVLKIINFKQIID